MLSPHWSSHNQGVRSQAADDCSAGAEKAVRKVLIRAWPEGTELRIVAVDDGVSTITTDMLSACSPHVREDISVMEDKVVKIAASKGLTISAKIKEGDPEQILIAEAREWEADCIVVGSRGAKKSSWGLFGNSVSAGLPLMLNAPLRSFSLTRAYTMVKLSLGRHARRKALYYANQSTCSQDQQLLAQCEIFGHHAGHITDGHTRPESSSTELFRRAITSSKCPCAGFRDRMVLLARSAADADRADHSTLTLQGNTTGKDHHTSIVRGVDSEELSTGLAVLG